MTTPTLLDDPTALLERAARIRLACFDVDGTLTDGRLWMDAEGREQKAFHIQDGLGLRLLEREGIRVVLVTARDSAVAKARGRDLKLSEVHVAVGDKRALLLEVAERHGIAPASVAMMGDDLVDLPAMCVALGLAGLTLSGAPAMAALFALGGIAVTLLDYPADAQSRGTRWRWAAVILVLAMLAACLAGIWWIFRTGYRLKT